MKKKILIIIVIIVFVFMLLSTMYLIDKYMMKNNKSVVFSTWGYDYAPPENSYDILEIQDNTGDENYTCLMALEKIYEDEMNEYYFSCIKGGDIIVKYVSGYQENVATALMNGHIILQDLDTHGIKYITRKKEEQNLHSFVGKVLEETTTYMLVEPDENAIERKSSDKIMVSYLKDNIDYLYGVGTKVKIYYDGEIMETYPARINSVGIHVLK